MGVAHARTVASLAAQGVSHKEIGERYGVVPSTVGHALKRWRRTGLIV
jgi:transposase